MKHYFISAIGTDSGKTLVSSIVTEALRADYWKPVQTGSIRDTDTVRSLISNSKTVFHPEAYHLPEPLSPHAAAQLAGVQIELQKINLPNTDNALVIEGAGGLLVPLNQHDYVVDVAQHLQAEVILVANLYLGSINHTLLSIRELERRQAENGLKVAGIIFNHSPVPASEEIILAKTSFPCLLKISTEPEPNRATVSKYAAILAKVLAAK